MKRMIKASEYAALYDAFADLTVTRIVEVQTMKRYIHSNTEMTEDYLLQLMEQAKEHIRDAIERAGLSDVEYIDDLSWGKNGFKIPIFQYGKRLFDEKQIDEFYWSYDELDEEEFGETAEDQMLSKLERFIEDRYEI